ncbi:hypothetical protein [Dongia sp.]|uniref:hypothetical protein n=1 Tax=Dongia sp. TaxID=1977262 RepID=UPI0035AF63E9
MTRKKANTVEVPTAVAAAVEPPVFTDPVLVVRTCNADFTSWGGFQWPSEGYVEAPDWRPTAECGHGLHGLLEGDGDWGLLDWSLEAKALIVEVDRAGIVEIGGKVKFKGALVRSVSSLAVALCQVVCDASRIVKNVTDLIRTTEAEATEEASGNASRLAASGYASQLAASGYASQLAASGDDSQLAASGNASRLAASGNASQLAASGDASQLAASGDDSQLAASGDDSRLAASGDDSIAIAAGYNATASAGPNGVIALTWHDGTRRRVTVGYVGEDGIEPNVDYRVDDTGKLVKA